MINWLKNLWTTGPFVPHDTMTVKEYQGHVDDNKRRDLDKLIKEDNLGSLTKKQLLDYAKVAGYKANASMNKAAIIKIISEK